MAALAIILGGAAYFAFLYLVGSSYANMNKSGWANEAARRLDYSLSETLSDRDLLTLAWCDHRYIEADLSNARAYCHNAFAEYKSRYVDCGEPSGGERCVTIFLLSHLIEDENDVHEIRESLISLCERPNDPVEHAPDRRYLSEKARRFFGCVDGESKPNSRFVVLSLKETAGEEFTFDRSGRRMLINEKILDLDMRR